MKEKGFTLIELLAVIIIIAVIALITIPIIINTIEKAKKNALVDSAYGILKAGNLYYMEEMSKKEETERYDFKVSDGKFVLEKDNTKTLKFTGKVPKTGILQIHSNGKEAIGICNDTYCACKSVSELKVNLKEENCNINEETGEIGKEELASEKKIKEWIEEAKLEMYPIGSIYTTTSAKKPNEYIGGTWEPYGQGKTLIGVGTGKDINNISKNFQEAETGGEYNHTLTVSEMPNHSHTIPALTGTTSSDGAHTHRFIKGGSALLIDTTSPTTSIPTTSGIAIWANAGLFFNNNKAVSGIANSGNHTHNVTTKTSTSGNAGNSNNHNNIQPYITVYFWKRVS